MDKKKNIIQTMIVTALVFTIFLSGVGISWSWFKAAVGGTGNTSSSHYKVTTASLGIVYTNGNEILGRNILPGWSQSKTFTIQNTGNNTAYYNLVWANISNSWINKSDLKYSLSSTNNGGTKASTTVPNTGTNITIVSNIAIPANTTQTYTLTVQYNNRNADQTSDAGKTLYGKIEVRESSIPNS